MSENALNDGSNTVGRHDSIVVHSEPIGIGEREVLYEEVLAYRIHWHFIIPLAAVVGLFIYTIVVTRKLRKRITELEARINQPPKSM